MNRDHFVTTCNLRTYNFATINGSRPFKLRVDNSIGKEQFCGSIKLRSRICLTTRKMRSSNCVTTSSLRGTLWREQAVRDNRNCGTTSLSRRGNFLTRHCESRPAHETTHLLFRFSVARMKTSRFDNAVQVVNFTCQHTSCTET